MEITLKNKDIIDVSDINGFTSFMVIENILLQIKYNQMLVKGEIYEINQETGEPESIGTHELNIELKINNSYEID